MKALTKQSFFLFLWATSSISYGQMENYAYKRELSGMTDQWHKIILPNSIFEEVNQDLSDLRIFGLTENKDTIEAPYLLHSTSEKITDKDVPFKLINTTHNDKGYYFTFEISTEVPINQIKLQFKQENFDWKVKLDGSQDQKEWFTVVENYRILSIKNNTTNFQFTKLTFPSTKYQYYRLFIKSEKKPELDFAHISEQTITEDQLRNYAIKNFNTEENKQLKRTEIDIELERPLRVNQLIIDISDKFDYYRPITIKYLSDSIKTELGWMYNYSLLASGTLNSLEDNSFKFTSKTIQKLKIVIDNQNNQPLSINGFQISGPIYELLARFTGVATYYLVYGNKNAESPQYDIERFSDKIPTAITTIELGNEQTIEKKAEPISHPLFENKIWLWIIMTVIILVLGLFSLKMIRKN